jgi:Domain of unknown function (DUF4272)
MSFTPSILQEKRRTRSVQILKKRNYPLYDGPLYSIDDSEAILRQPREVAKRALVLWMVALYADTTPQDAVLEIISQNNLEDDVSPEEATFMHDPKPDAKRKLDSKWRLEAAWILLWSLKKVCILNWPNKLCNCGKMVKVFLPMEHWGGLSGHFSLRNKSAILDMLDLTLRQHWAARQTRIAFPERISPEESSVVYQRHYALNWLVCPENESWDKVQTDT